MSGFISSFKQKGKDLCLALSQVPASFTVSLERVDSKPHLSQMREGGCFW